MKTSTVILLFLLQLVTSCSIEGRRGGTYKHQVSESGSEAVMTLNNFENGGGPSECDGQYHSNNSPVVALSSRWYNHGQRCSNYINIYYKDVSTQAMVVDECGGGCGDNIVDAVWVALGVSQSDWGETQITWSDAA